MVRSSPRARAGFSRLAASSWPAAPPAPISVCASSMNRMIGFGLAFDLVDHRLAAGSRTRPSCRRRPAAGRDRACAARHPSSAGGTSPAAMRSAKPSTTAVLPTPASPVRIGLFCRRRVRMSMTWRISESRPRTGSILPACARAVRSMVNWSSAPPPAGRRRAAAIGRRRRRASAITVPSRASRAVGGDRGEIPLQQVGGIFSSWPEHRARCGRASRRPAAPTADGRSAPASGRARARRTATPA